jgi:hypothetical protein
MLLITVLAKALTCWVTNGAISEEICVNSVEYRDVGRGDWTGFYDFLRTGEGAIIGIRYSPLLDDAAMLSDLKGKPYARVLPNSTFELFFSAERSFVPELSEDQDFGDNMVLRSASGEYALTFGVDDLKASEKAQLRSFATGLDLE